MRPTIAPSDSVANDRVTPIPLVSVRIEPFQSRWAESVRTWVDCDSDLRLLAPGSSAPLTTEKVLAWVKPGGFAATGWVNNRLDPVAYGEINPMLRRPGHFWLGHVIVRPDCRRRGIGGSFVRSLVQHAFKVFSAKEVALIVFPENTAAVECYLRVGFRMAGEEAHRFIADGPEERLLRMEINRTRLGLAI